jgi:hypothetical protein
MAGAYSESYLRKLNTQRLVRYCFHHLVSTNGHLSGEKLYELARLTWYFESAKNTTREIALAAIFELKPGEQLEGGIARVTSDTPRNIRKLLAPDTGYVRLYASFTKSSKQWLIGNEEQVGKIFVAAFNLSEDKDALQIIKAIADEKLGSIPSPNRKTNLPKENLLTPVLACLDQRRQFPIINGRSLNGILKSGGLHNRSLEEQYKFMVLQIELGIYRDSFDLDDAVENIAKPIERKKSSKGIGGRLLTHKDASDTKILLKSLSKVMIRLHNDMTNKVMKIYPIETQNELIREGSKCDGMYDVLCVRDAARPNLLIEVKSSDEMPNIRMAVGQLFDYRRRLPRNDRYKKHGGRRLDIELAVLLPKEPHPAAKSLLRDLKIEALWFTNSKMDLLNRELF